jgi:hypothetical protein
MIFMVPTFFFGRLFFPGNWKGAHLVLLPEGTDQGAPSEKHKAAPI